MIIRCLKGTADKGTIARLTDSLSLDCCVDADFAGLHGREPANDPSSAKSRAGCVISLAGCPLAWESRLQTAISLSTLEAECQALSASLRALTPVICVTREAAEVLDSPPSLRSTTYGTAFEDDNGASLLATQQRLTSRTKYFAVKWHHSWPKVQGGAVDVSPADTGPQRADCMTKGLIREIFERVREPNQGW